MTFAKAELLPKRGPSLHSMDETLGVSCVLSLLMPLLILSTYLY